jgi:multicomponent Na+:H+ antiporter subunit E
MILANSITLTPGTITLDCRGDELTVHCLTEEMAEGLEETIFEKKLKRIEAVLFG